LRISTRAQRKTTVTAKAAVPQICFLHPAAVVTGMGIFDDFAEWALCPYYQQKI
jgi:hypothetical protein